VTAQPLPVAMSSPLDQAIDAFIKAWPAVFLAVGGGVWAWLNRARKAWKREREEQRLQAKAVRYLVDGARHQLRAHLQGAIHDADLYNELARQKTLLDGVRDELWVHDGHASARETEHVVEVLTRTQRIKAKTERLTPVTGPQDMFGPDDVAEDRRRRGDE